MRESNSFKRRFTKANCPYVYMSSDLIQMAVLAKNSRCVFAYMKTLLVSDCSFSIFDFLQHIFRISCAFPSKQGLPLQRMAFSKQISRLMVDPLDEKNTRRESTRSFILSLSQSFDYLFTLGFPRTFQSLSKLIYQYHRLELSFIGLNMITATAEKSLGDRVTSTLILFLKPRPERLF